MLAWRCGVWWRRQSETRTVIDLIWLSPLLVDKDDGHQDDDLSHNTEEGPESSEAAADTQVDLIGVWAEFVVSRADVVSHVSFDVQVINGESGIVRGAPDLILVAGAVDVLRVILKQQVSKNRRDHSGLCYFIIQVFRYHNTHTSFVSTYKPEH